MMGNGLFRSILGKVPMLPDLAWLLVHRDGKINSRFQLSVFESNLDSLLRDILTSIDNSPITGKKVFLFASWHYWITHTTLCALVLRGLGYDVTIGYLPYGDYDKQVNPFDLKIQDLYTRHYLKKLLPYVKNVPFLEIKPVSNLPQSLARVVENITTLDAQYTLQREDVSSAEPIYRLRAERNASAAGKAMSYFLKERPDVVVIPNGMIQEYAVVYETARSMGINAVTYEFGEHNHRVWLGKNRLVIHHIIDELWESRRKIPLNRDEHQWLDGFLTGRQKQKPGDDFAHLWQKSSLQGGEEIRTLLGLDDRPILLLPTNVLGDSATLGLTTFSASMTEWLQQVIKYLAGRTEVQVVVRIHPAETWTVGPSVAEIIQEVLPELPAHIRLIGPKEKINTYDLIELTSLALVYTTTTGLEMAVRGIPVLVSGRAHYRKKGFTLDADSWDEYFFNLDAALKDLSGYRLKQEQVGTAKQYAYCFFNEYPLPFPWHLEKIEADLKINSLAYVLSPEGRAKFESTFHQMVGEPSIGVGKT